MTENFSVHDLLIQLKQGRVEVIDVLYSQHVKKFYWYARRRNLTHEDAEDAVQNTFRNVLQCIKSYREIDGGGERWLWRICEHAVTDVLRQKPTSEIPEDYICEGVEPANCFENKERSQAIKYALEEISENDRKEIEQGRGRGPGRKAWHQAIDRFRSLYTWCLDNGQDALDEKER